MDLVTRGGWKMVCICTCFILPLWLLYWSVDLQIDVLFIYVNCNAGVLHFRKVVFCYLQKVSVNVLFFPFFFKGFAVLIWSVPFWIQPPEELQIKKEELKMNVFVLSAKLKRKSTFFHWGHVNKKLRTCSYWLPLWETQLFGEDYFPLESSYKSVLTMRKIMDGHLHQFQQN